MKVAKNLKGKTRPASDPYEVITQGGWEWRVLKHYQSTEAELKNPYARVFAAVSSPYTWGSADLGDTYISDIPGLREQLEWDLQFES